MWLVFYHNKMGAVYCGRAWAKPLAISKQGPPYAAWVPEWVASQRWERGAGSPQHVTVGSIWGLIMVL